MRSGSPEEEGAEPGALPVAGRYSAGVGTFRETGSVRRAGSPCEAGTAGPVRNA